MKIALAGDHAGYDFKREIENYLKNELSIESTDFGTNSEDSCDYPDYIHPAAKSIVLGKHDLGIFVCGSGNGVCMTANKYPEIRAALCWNEELAELARLHNNANVICIPSRMVSMEVAIQMVKIFIETSFEGGRHQRRVEKISSEL